MWLVEWQLAKLWRCRPSEVRQEKAVWLKRQELIVELSKPGTDWDNDG